MKKNHKDIRIALPSKGRLSQAALDFLAAAGLAIHKPNPRQFEARIPAMPDLYVLFQRAGDIAVSVRDGSVDFGITGRDIVAERGGDNGKIIPLHRKLGFGQCTLNVIVPEAWDGVHTMQDLADLATRFGRPLRVATKYPNLTRTFLAEHDLGRARLIAAEGTLEVAPAIGYADLIVDLVSTGTTLKDNRLRTLADGQILESEACLIANDQTIRDRPEVLAMARLLLEFVVAHLRATANVSVFANITGGSPEDIAAKMFSQSVIGGLQGPTISKAITQKEGSWYAVHIIVKRSKLAQAITELRNIGGSGVVVTPVTYIFEEEPEACRLLDETLADGDNPH
jgi:ATP phosphoribosyltransferase